MGSKTVDNEKLAFKWFAFLLINLLDAGNTMAVKSGHFADKRKKLNNFGDMLVQGTTWTGRQLITGPHRDNRACSHSLQCVFGWREEAGVPGKNTHLHRENMQTPHRKNQPGIKPLAMS